MAVGPVIKLLQAIRNLTKVGSIKSIEQAMKLAKRELGDKLNTYKNQINDAFKQGKKELDEASKPKKIKEKKSADIIQFPKKDKGIMSTEEASPMMKNLEEIAKNLQVENVSTGLTRTMARDILMKRGIEIAKGVDPLDKFRKIFGQDTLVDVNNLAEEVLEIERMGKTPKNLDEILQQSGLYDTKIPDAPPQGFSDDELIDFMRRVEEEEAAERVLKDFDPTDRKPNAKGGLNYLMGL